MSLRNQAIPRSQGEARTALFLTSRCWTTQAGGRPTQAAEYPVHRESAEFRGLRFGLSIKVQILTLEEERS